MAEQRENRQLPRFTFADGHRPLVKYKIMSGKTNDHIYDAALLDLSETGAKLLGDLPDDQIFDLGNGMAKLGCNIYLGDKLIKTLATARWFKLLPSNDYEFGIQFCNPPQLAADLQKFLIRHQIDTRRFARQRLP